MEAVLAWYPLSYGEVNSFTHDKSICLGSMASRVERAESEDTLSQIPLASYWPFPHISWFAGYSCGQSFKVICSCLEPGLLISIASGESFCAESDKLGFISSWYMSVFFLLSLLTLNIYLQKRIKRENALVTPMIRVSTHGELNVITTTRDDDLHAARQTVYPLYPKENLFPSSNR